MADQSTIEFDPFAPEYADDAILGAGDIYKELRPNAASTLTPGNLPFSASVDCLRQAVDEDAFSADFVVVTRTKQMNRNGVIVQILPDKEGKGMMLDNYKANPIVFLDHGGIGIGNAEDPNGKFTVKATKSKMTATLFFAQDDGYAEGIGRLVMLGVYRATSISYRPFLGRRLKQKKKPELDEELVDLAPEFEWYQYGKLDIIEADLWEISVVGLGADTGALRQYVSRGHIQGEKITPLLMHQMVQQCGPEPVQGIGFDVVAGQVALQNNVILSYVRSVVTDEDEKTVTVVYSADEDEADDAAQRPQEPAKGATVEDDESVTADTEEAKGVQPDTIYHLDSEVRRRRILKRFRERSAEQTLAAATASIGRSEQRLLEKIKPIATQGAKLAETLKQLAGNA